MTRLPDLTGWIPIRLYWDQSRLMVDWCHLGRRRFTAPFFSETIETRLRLPFNLVFRHQTPIEALLEWQERQPGLTPSGFVFHMSRCGSTLIAQMLAALPQNLVLSEPGPIDAVLRADGRGGEVSDAQRGAWLRALISSLGQRWRGGETHLFIKFDSWHAMYLPLIRQAFPDVPWIFVYREPVEVLVSQINQRGAQMVPGMIEPAPLGMDLMAAIQLKPEEFCARFLARICQAALERHADNGRLVNYRELPEAVCSTILTFFRVPCSTADAETMQQAARFDAKSPSMPFGGDSADKNLAATDLIRRMSDLWVKPVYEKLEAARLGEA